MPTSRETTGPGYFRWNPGGWFGSQVGCTAWLVVGAAVLAPRTQAVAGVWVGCRALANAAGVWLWRRRDSIRPYAVLQWLILTCGVSGLVAFLSLDTLRPDVAAALDWPRYGYRVLLIFPAIMGRFAFLEYSSRRRARSPELAAPAAETDRLLSVDGE